MKTQTPDPPQPRPQVVVDVPKASVVTEDTHAVGDKPRYNADELGRAMEQMSQQILQRMGYKTELRQRLKDKSGSSHEIDIYATRGTKVRAVECKNFGDNRSVGMEDLRNFAQKLFDLKIPNGLFVTNVRFSGQAEDYASSKKIELWDGHELRERFFSLTIGRLAPSEQAIFENALPLKIEYASAISTQLKNPNSVKISQCQLVFYPYFRIDYRLKAVRVDPTKEKHTVTDEGTYIVDGLDGEIINLKEKTVSKMLGFLKGSSSDKTEKTIQKWVTEDIISLPAESKYSIDQSSDFGISKIRPDIAARAAQRAVIDQVIQDNIEDASYEVRIGKDKYEKRKMTITPKADEVSIRNAMLIYVPNWNIELEAGNRTYARTILASSSRAVTDEISLCPEHLSVGKFQLVKKQTVAVCELCGQAYCESHITLAPDGVYYCSEHLPEQYRPQEESKPKFGFKLPFGR